MNRTEFLEKGGSKVKDEVYTGELLHHLHGNAEKGSSEITAAVEKGALETIGPRAEVAALGDHAHFVLVIGDDLGQFLLDVVRVTWLATESFQDVCGFGQVSFFDEVTGGVREVEQTGGED